MDAINGRSLNYGISVKFYIYDNILSILRIKITGPLLPKTDHNKFLIKYFSLPRTGRLKYLTLTEANRVWMPDLFFSNEKEGHFHNIIMPNVYIRIFPYGSVLYSIRISLTLACPMNLKLYPLDRQVCSLRMASCKYKISLN